MKRENRKMMTDNNNAEQSVRISMELSMGLKGIAILMVMTEHVLRKYGLSEYGANVLGTGGVNLFLILSGCGLYFSFLEKGLGFRYWENKVRKVYVPYLAVTLIYCLLFLRTITSKALLDNILLIDYERKIDGTMWYLSFLLIWYVVFFVLFSLPLPDMLRIVLLLVFATFIKGNAYEYFKNCSWQFVTNAFAFPVGVIAGYLFQWLDGFSRKKGIIIALDVLAIPAACLYIWGCTRKNMTFGMMGILLFISLRAIVRWCLKNKIFARIVTVIGANSYFLYLIEGKVVMRLSGIEAIDKNAMVFLPLFALLCAALCCVWCVWNRWETRRVQVKGETQKDKGYAKKR